jgi:hypothetical protein
LDVTRAEGALADFAAFGGVLDADLTPTEMKEVALRFQTGDTRLGELRASGPFDLEKLEGRLSIVLSSVDKRLLNLAAARQGLDFGPTTISSTNQVEFAKGGSLITVRGRLDVNSFQVTRANQTTPRLDLRNEYDLTVDPGQHEAVLRNLRLVGTRDGNPLLKAELTNPMQIFWNKLVGSALGDSALTLTVSSLNLADWKPFLGDAAPVGMVNVAAKVLSHQSGQPTTIELGSRFDHLALSAADGQVSGTVDLKAKIIRQPGLAVAGSLALSDFTGQLGRNEFLSFGAAMDFDVEMTPEQIQVRKAAGNLTQAGNAAGSFDLTATYDLTKKTADLKARLADWNQHALGSFLAPMLADKQLVSVALNANAAAQYDPQGASALKADLQVANLVIKDPKGQIPATPIEAKMQVDAALHKQVADVRLFQLALTPTARATNVVQLTGQVDMSRTNAIQGNLKLVADSLDLTRYYDLFMGQKQVPAQGSAPAAPTAATADANKEPEAIQLPFRNFTASASIRRFYLREVEIADWQASLKLDGGRVVLNPFKLTLNGAPVNTTADLDLGVPGWKYDVSLSALAVPLAPLVNSFQPERKGQVAGTATAQGRISGAGVTGASLQKNLTGQFDVSSTNLNFSVVNIQNPVFKAVINVIAGIPELLRNPAAGLGSLVGNLTGGKAGASGGLADELQRSPIDAINARVRIGAGSVDLQEAAVQSAAFLANASGAITLAPVLTNSTLRIPVTVSLSQTIAQRMNLASADTNAAYAKLPDFLTMRGTLGEPKADINKTALAGTVLKSITGFVPAAGKTGGGLLDSLLGTQPSGATNRPATNQSPVDSLIKGLFKPKKK